MSKHNHSILMIVSGMLATGIMLSMFLTLTAKAMPWLNPFRRRQAVPQAGESFIPSHWAQGQVKLEYALPGVYSDPLPTPDPATNPLPNLGEMDLGLQLVLDDSSLSGYVDLEYTLVFTGAHIVSGTVMGPAVSGSFDGENLTLLSEKISLVSNGIPLQRQFRITGTVQGSQLIGEYRETVWGYTPQPQTVVGSYAMAWVSRPPNKIYLPVMARK